jgi:outer membrane immunogenic protein
MTFKVIGAICATGIIFASSFAANAADLPRPGYKAPLYSAPAYANWTGFYVGVNVGYGFGKSDWDSPPTSPAPKGVLAGLTLGYNYQIGTWLFGIEGDADYSGMKGSATCFGGLDTCETKNSWLATARGRIGYAGWNNWLPYITAGAAGGDVKATESFNGSATKTKIGWTAGLGVEYAMWSSWSVKLEYLYVDLGKFDCGVSCSGGGPANVSFKANLVRAGLNYRF